MSIGDYFEEFFKEMNHILCKEEGIGQVFGKDEGEASLIACKESDECSSIIFDSCATEELYVLCNGAQFELTEETRLQGTYGGTPECNKAARKKCECL